MDVSDYISEIIQILKHTTNINKLLTLKNDEDMFIDNGINTFIQNNEYLSKLLFKIIKQLKTTINMKDIFTEIITKNIKTKRTENFWIIFKIFLKKYILQKLFIDNNENNKNIIKIFQFMLMYNIYEISFVINDKKYHIKQYIIDIILQNIIIYIIKPIEKMLKKNEYRHITGHFIESIIIKRSSMNIYHAITTNKSYDKNTKKWSYYKKDYQRIIDEIINFKNKIILKNKTFNKYFLSIIPHIYIDKCIKLNENINSVIEITNEYYNALCNSFYNFSEYVRVIRACVYTIISMKNFYNKNKNKIYSSIINSSPLKYETDMLTPEMIIELKTEYSDSNKNLKKMLLETLLPLINNTKIHHIQRNILLINIKSCYINYIDLYDFDI